VERLSAFAPDLVIEIRSPSTSSYDRKLKRKHYLESGVSELWFVDTDARSIEVWRPSSDEPARVDETLTWSVGDASFELPLGRSSRGSRRSRRRGSTGRIVDPPVTAYSGA